MGLRRMSDRSPGVYRARVSVRGSGFNELTEEQGDSTIVLELYSNRRCWSAMSIMLARRL